MRILAVDNNVEELREINIYLKRNYPNDEILIFTNPMLAVKYALNHSIDMIYSDILMRGLDGFEMGRLMRKFQPNVKIHFFAENMSYEKQSTELQINGYHLKKELQ